ncbi:hypothetical protein M0R45_038310 [Rubus argutus]|uniref:Uncharacterized protein n=1 Tax=Rubus argutus TaxID=59490 RepID=A0AAW1W325_RUBAR
MDPTKKEEEVVISDQTGRLATSFWWGEEEDVEGNDWGRWSLRLTEREKSMRGRSWASSGLVMSWSSCVERLMHEHRSSDAKKAEATCVPSQLRHELRLSIGDRRSATLSLTLLCSFAFHVASGRETNSADSNYTDNPRPSVT